jgi:site-specific DNA recombinase
MAKLYREQVARLAALVERPETRDDAMEAVRSLIEAVVLTPEAGELRIDLQGDLAAILALGGLDARKPAAGRSGDGLLEQVKLVAGAEFEPATFRL